MLIIHISVTIEKAITIATNGYGFTIFKAKKSFGFALPLETVTTL